MVPQVPQFKAGVQTHGLPPNLSKFTRVYKATSLRPVNALHISHTYYVALFVCLSTISRQPAGRFTPKFACRRTLVPDVSSPLLGVGGPPRAEKVANEIFVTMGVNGEFLHFGGF